MDSFLSLTTPDNLGEEKEKFFRSSTYHPVFHYDWQINKRQYLRINKLKQELLENVFAQDHRAISSTAGKLFETRMDDSVIGEAEEILRYERQEPSSGSAEEFAQIIRDAFAFFSIPYEVFIVDTAGFNARPDHTNRALLISRHIHFEMFSMEGGLRHDLTHIMRYLNGKENNIKRSRNYLPTEEGLASFTQDHFSGSRDNGHIQHAIEFLSSRVGMEGSLRDIYDFMRACGMSSELAWKRASRHKFGFVDTSLPGDIMKPAMYFANEQKVAQLTAHEKVRLFVGKIAINDLPEYPEYHGLWPENQISEYFNL